MKETGLSIRVVGHRWWWEVQYPDHGVIDANEIYIPVGEPVRLYLTSADIIHSFWVPQLHGKMDMIPGKTNEFWIEADRPGVYRGQCAEYCGLQHAKMAFEVIAIPKERFVDWLNNNNPQTLRPLGETSRESTNHQGHQLFAKHGCSACHAIRDTRYQGVAGPNLTLLASRKTLAAATIENNRENLISWLVDPQAIKPGANMPATHAPLDEIVSIVDYLLSQGAGGKHE